MNVIIYARYSSDRQTEQSIEGQLKECYEYAQRNGYTVVGEYIDRAISGTTDHHPEFLRMIADGDKKLFQAVLVYQLDRFARNRYDSATYKARLKTQTISKLPMATRSTRIASTVFSATSAISVFTPTVEPKYQTDCPASFVMICFMRCRI